MSDLVDGGNEGFAFFVADVSDAAGVLRRYGDGIAVTVGQTQARWQVLSVVSVGAWTVPMAADRLGTSRQAVQRIANELVSDGLAEFLENPSHRRSPFLHLTEAGEKTLSAITDRAHLRHTELLARLSASDLVALRSALRDLTAKVRVELDSVVADLSIGQLKRQTAPEAAIRRAVRSLVVAA
jgi:DNA-binding MarR family transcriptional regulator